MILSTNQTEPEKNTTEESVAKIDFQAKVFFVPVAQTSRRVKLTTTAAIALPAN